MEKKFSLDGKWSLAYIDNKTFVKDAHDISTVDAVKRTGYKTIEAEVPGNFEIDFMRAGIIDDIYYSDNILKCQKLENTHLIYYRTFEYTGKSGKLRFEGIDTVADIYVNGKLIGQTDNMLIPHEFTDNNIKYGTNEIVVHITPAHIAARKYPLSPSANAFKYNFDGLYIRKAPHMYGWDIMPRLLSGGIWRHVSIVEESEDRIDDVFLITSSVDVENKSAWIYINFNISVANDDLEDYSLDIDGNCGDSYICARFDRLWHTGMNKQIRVSNCKFWWPRNYGEPNLYELVFKLKYKGEVVDTYTRKVGIRTIELERTSVTDKAGSGEFCFRVNGRKIFVLGTNWVPVDALHSNDEKRLPEILPMLNELGCNAVRCWGGNVYENDIFYDFCDENGIMVWQDFSMACAINPQDPDFIARFRKEVETVVLRLRHHPCICLWAGDNEVDSCGAYWEGTKRDPNNNLLNRKVIPDVLWVHDFTRPYLPSSPYMDIEAWAAYKNRDKEHEASEWHLWGPRDYFKGEYYRNTICHFASETGYHGCNSPKSLKKFIAPEQLWPWRDNPEDKLARRDWLVHAACMEASDACHYSYRIPLMANQVKTLFGSEPDNLDDFARASQISQAEAKKYFIERFRVTKWRRTGIIWWNLIDGWPQISDAIVDYYYVKKLAYHYIKRSQQAVCMIFDEPTGTQLPLHIVNDTDGRYTVNYKVTDLSSGKELINTSCTAEPHESVKVWNMNIESDEKKFYFIEWNYVDQSGNTVSGKNHYMTNILDIAYDEYIENMKKCGFYDEFEGF